MFIGEYNHNLDEKNRVTMPVKFREELGDVFYMTKGFDNCLFVYSAQEWERFSTRLQNNQLKSRDARKLQRFFIASANECGLDKQGRILVSTPLKEYAEIQKELVIVGVANRIEVWSKENWDAYNNDDETDISALAEEMDSLDL
ncbi:division/cell wall cluster transcriptional repressor MraZ [Anaerotalea alkaliphila]|uniref:Transcriptional regulator MraZ n=1 Tax=Anaerotalea alkaliphila TaxID=2662126 RepID=A0A7X5KKU3_9FIRM|nr:division/cell wall cluster transcriptional repressor MraZ [Anaerotalea alkaliphila]